MKDMVIVLPGILGSVLQKEGKDLWAPSGQSILNLVARSQRTMASLALGFDDPTLDDLGDGIQATALIKDLHLVPGLVKVDGYTRTTRMIVDNFQVAQGDIYHDPADKPANFYHFPYDWRRDNRVHAHKLKALVELRLRCWRAHSGASDAKVILLAHSMGGLVARYYLEVLSGWRDARALFTFGTPHRGSINSLNFLTNGYKKLSLDFTAVMRSLTSVYQLLPLYPAVKIGEDYVRVTETEKLPNVNLDRAADARTFHDEIYDAVQANRKDERYRNEFTTVPVVGIRQPTLQSAELIGDKLIASEQLPKVLQGRTDFLDGDGTVPKISAIPNELSNSFSNKFIAETHGSLQNQEQILRSVKDAIATTQFTDAFAIRDVPNTIGLAVDDVYLPDEPIVLRAQVIAYPKVTELQAVITPVAGSTSPLVLPFKQTHTEHWSLSLDSLPTGLYRVVVSTPNSRSKPSPSPVNSSFEVIDSGVIDAC
ncbi:MAG: lecithin--cholesterol acyltransferase [Cyanobacteria bacterium J06623_4]